MHFIGCRVFEKEAGLKADEVLFELDCGMGRYSKPACECLHFAADKTFEYELARMSFLKSSLKNLKIRENIRYVVSAQTCGSQNTLAQFLHQWVEE